MSRVEVAFPVSREVAFDYLVDPHRRIEWQGSLRRVEDVGPLPPQVGTSWRDVALGEVVSQMRLTVVDRPTRWAEVGTWKGVTMDLALTFGEAPGGCLVTADIMMLGEGASRLMMAVVKRSMPRSVRRDLTRAAGILDGTVEPRDP